VPFLVHYPPLFPAGRVVEEGIDVLDVLPTVTDALGTSTPDAVQGESLVPLETLSILQMQEAFAAAVAHVAANRSTGPQSAKKGGPIQRAEKETGSTMGRLVRTSWLCGPCRPKGLNTRLSEISCSGRTRKEEGSQLGKTRARH